MSSMDRINKLAERFAHKLSLAQAQTAQPGDIDGALSRAGVRPSSNDIAPLLNTAKVPDNVSIDIRAVVDKNMNVKFHVAATPTHASANSLAAVLDRTYAPKMSSALKGSGLVVDNPVTVNIANFAA